jgi:hypothetical protein
MKKHKYSYFNNYILRVPFGFINSKFTYKVCKQEKPDSLSFLYVEYYNDKQILNLVFNEMEWSVIEECSKDIISIEELIRKVIKKNPDATPVTIKSIINDLNRERLLYIDQYTMEVFCIIDSEMFDSLL